MNNWLSHTKEERITMLQKTAEKKNLPDNAIEKDWWVTKVLQALFMTEIGQYCRFKGGTSLSKGWNLTNRLSEDVDISLSRELLNYPTNNNSQLKKLRIKSRKYLVENLPTQLTQTLNEIGVKDFIVEAATEADGVSIPADADPTVFNVKYDSIAEQQSNYLKPVVKLEISCLSMDEPTVIRNIGTMIGELFPDADENSQCDILTVHPSRTFLEKAFLLSEEFQKDNPRSLRMSRHLYDLERLMDTDFAIDALQNTKLYKDIVDHRQKFYHIGRVEYKNDYPQRISFCPTGRYYNEFEKDYNVFKKAYVYGSALPYKDLIARIKELEQRFRNIMI